MSAAEPSDRRPATPIPVVSFVDLDDTLFESAARGGHGRAVSVTRDGRPQGFMSPRQQRLFTLLRQAGRVIPTTARSPAQLRRVHLPFDDHAICANGALILDPDGTPDPVWAAAVERRLERLPVSAEAVAERAASAPGGHALRVEAVDVHGRPLMVDVRAPGRRSEPMTAWAVEMRSRLPDGWALDVARDRALLHPMGLDKQAAVRWFIRHRVDAEALVLGAGDRHGDRGFLAACDFALMPTGSVLFASTGAP